MRIMDTIREIFNTQSASREVHDIRNEIMTETFKTTYKLGQVRKSLNKNAGVIKQIAKVVGATK